METEFRKELKKLVDEFYNSRTSRENIQIRAIFLMLEILVYMVGKK